MKDIWVYRKDNDSDTQHENISVENHSCTADTAYQNIVSLLLGSLHCKSTKVNKSRKKKKFNITILKPNIEFPPLKCDIEQTSLRLGKNLILIS